MKKRMHITNILLLLLMSSSPSPAQIIRYGRDDAGNRTSKSMLLQRTVEEGEDREVSFCAQPLELRTDMPRVVRSIQWNPDQTASVGDIPMNTGVLPNGMVTVQVPLVSGSSEGINPDIQDRVCISVLHIST